MKDREIFFNSCYFAKKLFKKHLFILFILIVANGCHQNGVKIFNESSEKAMIIPEKMIHDIPMDIYFSFGQFLLIDSFMVIFEANPKNNNIFHLLNRKNFNHILSAGSKGRGPGEITPGASNIFINKHTKSLMVMDFGKYIMYNFPIDSLLINKDFLPEKKLEIDNKFFMGEGSCINDSILLGTGIIPINNSTADQRIVSFNINKNSIDYFGFNRNDIKHSDTYGHFDLCLENEIYVKTYPGKGLLDICNLEGAHILTIKDANINNNQHYESFASVKIYKNYIITSILGDFSSIIETKGELDLSKRTFIIFDLKGNHIKTIKTEGGFSNWTIDDDNKRLIIYFNDRKHLLGYINLTEILP